MKPNIKNNFIILSLPLIFASCVLARTVSVSEQYTPTENIEIVHINQPLPANLTRIGSITIDGNSSLVWTADECSYETCMQLLIEEAKKVGADVVYIVSVIAPNAGFMATPYFYSVSGSSCYTIVADIYIKKDKKPVDKNSDTENYDDVYKTDRR